MQHATPTQSLVLLHQVLQRGQLQGSLQKELHWCWLVTSKFQKGVQHPPCWRAAG